MRVLITGVNGLLGREAARQLQAAGHDVYGCDLRPVRGVPGREVDVVLAAEVTAAVAEARPEAILHTAGLVGPIARRRPFAAAHVNVAGTLNLLEAARAHGVRRFVLCSTSLVYDYAAAAEADPPIEAMREDRGPYGPAEVYGGSKLAAEALVEAYGRNFGFEAVALRFARIYGPVLEQTEGGAMKELGPAIRALLERREVVIPIPPDPRRSEYVYVRDAARGCLLALTAEGASGPYNVGSGELHSLSDALDLLQELAPASARWIRREVRQDARRATSLEIPLSLERSGAGLGYRPAFPLREGLRDLLAELGHREG